MEYMAMRALSRDTKTVLANLQRDGELVITNNGQPSILMIDLSNSDLIDVANDFRHTCYVKTKLKQADEWKKDPDAVWYEHDTFWKKVKEL